MWKSKRVIIVAVLMATVVIVGGAGIVLAQESGDDSQPKTLLERVTDILVSQGVNITSEQLKDAFAQARSEMQNEALEKWLQNLVEQGKITQEEADQYLEWWQARPDVPVGLGFKSLGGFHGRGMPHGMGGLCAPTQ